MRRYGVMWGDMGRSLSHLEQQGCPGYMEIWGDVRRCGEMYLAPREAEWREIRGDMGRYGEIWGDMGKLLSRLEQRSVVRYGEI